MAFPLGRFIVVTGVSGSGKSSLVTDTLYNALAVRIHRARLLPGAHNHITGAEHVDLWPLGADGGGFSLDRIHPALYGNDPNNWRQRPPSPGVDDP